MSDWVDVAQVEQIAPGQGRTVSAGAAQVALFNDGGEFFAIDDACPHQGASLGDGLLHEGRVICPLHSWIFELDTGQCPRGSHGGVRTYETRVADGVVSVRIPPGGAE